MPFVQELTDANHPDYQSDGKFPSESNGWGTQPRGRIVGLIEHKGRFFCATELRVYEMTEGGIWCPMLFTDAGQPDA